MVLRLVIGGVVWLGVLVVFGAMMMRTATPEVKPPVTKPGSSLAQTLTERGQHERPRYPGWTVTRATSAHHVLVAHVETDRPETGRSIAVQIVEPVKNRYQEILIYFHRPGESHTDLAQRRIQWTPRGGYVEQAYGR
jgi:hypothetical protein